MTREELIEKMARALDPYAWDADSIGQLARELCRNRAERCLSAIEAAGWGPKDAAYKAGLEAAAELADKKGEAAQVNTRDPETLMQALAAEEMAYDIATAIRQLASEKQDADRR